MRVGGVWCVSKEFLLFWFFDGRCNEHIGLSVGFADAVAGDFEVIRLALYADE